MTRRVAWAALVGAIVAIGIGGYEIVCNSARAAGEMTIRGKK